jgi:DNA modification methylase
MARKANVAPGGGGGKGAWAERSAKVKGGLVYGEMNMEDGAERTLSGTSIFDPVLCELAYRWFCPAEGVVLDPFAGGSVRGIVASKLGRLYVGIDLRPEQVEANRAQAKALCKRPMPKWIVGDSLELEQLTDVEADFLFSCPPYADLERYSEDPRDLSNMDYDAFLAAYRKIIAAGAARLKDDRFACFIVGDVRDRKGLYRGFPAHTQMAFEETGLRLYNDAVLVTMAGSLPVRAGKQFETSRKLGKTHQNCLVFVKGDPKKATAACGDVEFGAFDDPAAAFGDLL